MMSQSPLPERRAVGAVVVGLAEGVGHLVGGHADGEDAVLRLELRHREEPVVGDGLAGHGQAGLEAGVGHREAEVLQDGRRRSSVKVETEMACDHVLHGSPVTAISAPGVDDAHEVDGAVAVVVVVGEVVVDGERRCVLNSSTPCRARRRRRRRSPGRAGRGRRPGPRAGRCRRSSSGPRRRAVARPGGHVGRAVGLREHVDLTRNWP